MSASEFSSGIEEFVDQVDGDIMVVNAADWLVTEPPPPDQVLADTLDIGDKMVVIGASKQRKSFFFQQLSLSLTTGRDFLNWRIQKPRRVLYVQFEIRAHHLHRRLLKFAKGMGISPEDIGDRLQLISARGKKGFKGQACIDRITRQAKKYGSEVIMIDPLYKISEGVENAAEDFKTILAAFDEIAEETAAAIIFIHHDTKGHSGDKELTDRGAGSGVLGRDYDASIVLTPHCTDKETSVVEVVTRNYPPQEAFAVAWYYGEGGFRFNLADDVSPEKKTSKTKPAPPPLESYLPAAAAVLGRNEINITLFKTLLKERTGLSRDRANDFTTWATQTDNPPLVTREEKAKGKNIKTVRLRPDHEVH